MILLNNQVKGKRSHTADTSAFGCRTMSSNCSVSWLRYNQRATPGGFAFPTRNSWYPLYRLRRDERLGEPRPGFETTKSRVRPPTGIEPSTPRSQSNALRLTLPTAFEGAWSRNFKKRTNLVITSNFPIFSGGGEGRLKNFQKNLKIKKVKSY